MPFAYSPRLTVTLLCIGIAAALGIYEAAAPMPLLVDAFLPDDAFYYFTTAAHFARQGIPTFDGVNVTSGFHPLWFLVCALAYLFLPIGSELALRILLVAQALMVAVALGWLFWTISRRIAAHLVLVPILIFVGTCAPDFVNGLETPLVIFLVAAIFAYLLRLDDPRLVLSTWQGRTGLGILLGLLFLARTDQAFTVMAFALITWLAWLPAGKFMLKTWYWTQIFAPAAVIGFAYLLYNYVLTGHAMQVSGVAKQFYSAQRLPRP